MPAKLYQLVAVPSYKYNFLLAKTYSYRFTNDDG